MCCLFLLAIGCNSGKSGLKGKVVFSDDQTPLDGGTVCFVSDQGISRGAIGKDGSYVAGSIGANDGLPPGNYRIYFMDTELYEDVPGGGLPKMIRRIDAKYESPDTSGLTLEVKKSMTHDIHVDRYGGSR